MPSCSVTPAVALVLVLALAPPAAGVELDNLLLPSGDEALDFRKETAAKLRRLDGDWLEQWRQHLPAYAAPATPPPLAQHPPQPQHQDLCNASPSQWTPLQHGEHGALDSPSWDRVDPQPYPYPPSSRPRPQTPFRPSQPLVTSPVPPCFALIQLPPGPGRSFQLQFAPAAFSPDQLPSWIVSTGDLQRPAGEAGTCLWTLRAPAGRTMKVAVQHAQWGPARNCSEGSVRIHSHDSTGDLKPVTSICAPAESTASADVDSDAAVLSARLSPSATFTLSVELVDRNNATALPPSDLQPPPPHWGPYPWSTSNVDVESIHLTHSNSSQNFSSSSTPLASPPSNGTLQEPGGSTPEPLPTTPKVTTTTPIQHTSPASTTAFPSQPVAKPSNSSISMGVSSTLQQQENQSVTPPMGMETVERDAPSQDSDLLF